MWWGVSLSLSLSLGHGSLPDILLGNLVWSFPHPSLVDEEVNGIASHCICERVFPISFLNK